MSEFTPMGDIPVGVYLTVYGGNTAEFQEMPLEEMVQDVREGRLKLPIGRVFKLDQIVEAHELMEKNALKGKGVVLTE